MKKNRWASIHKVLKIGLPFYALLLFLLSSISSIGVTHAASSLCLPLLCTPTPTPMPTPMPTPTPTPMPTPTPTPMPTPTPTPQVQPTPIIYVPPVEPTPTDTPTPVTPTATPVTATATTVTVNPNKTTTTKTDTTSANEQPQGTGDKGINIVMISLGVAIPVLLFTGGMIWLLWRRQANQYNPAIQGQGALLNAPASPWMNNHVMLPNADPFPYASPTALVPGVSGQPTVNPYQYAPPAALAPGVSGASGQPTVNPFPYAPSTTLVPGASGMSGALPMLGGIQPMPSPQPTYTPSDLRPMTSAFPRQMPTSSSNNEANPAQNSDLQPLPLDNLSLPPQSIRERASNGNGNGHKTTGPIAVLIPPLMDTPVPFMSAPLPVPPVLGQAQASRPPSIHEDSMLEEVMRQAQMGLFVYLSRQKTPASRI